MKPIIVERSFHGRTLTIETGRLAKLAGGSALVTYGDSSVLVTACIGKQALGDFLPLSIDYIEKTYAAGKIPGGYFKREGKLSEKETLISRLIDRPCRPLFPERFNNEVQVVATVVSADDEIDTDVLAIIGASAALTVSEIPFQGPIAGVRVGRVGGKLVINPTTSMRKDSDLDFVVASTKDAIVMVEGGAKEVSEKDVLEALFVAQKECQPLIEMQIELQQKAGKKKINFVPPTMNEALVKEMTTLVQPLLEKAVRIKEKLARRDALGAAKKALAEKFVKSDDPKAGEAAKTAEKVFEDTQYNVVRRMVFDEKVRIDGRDFRTVRPITVQTGVLPRAHGSALFTRGETQALVVATLGTKEEAQRLDNLIGENVKTFMLHYNFPGYSVGEVKRMMGAGRREIGHGALAERALLKVLPTEAQFPYVVRIVSEILESNGSSSMATVCGGSLAMMDAGIPTKSQVAGVAMGLMQEGSNSVILTDILGDEDHLGDMDFKVCGTEVGITALQMDIKISGLQRETVDTALTQAKEARLHILAQMNAVLAKSKTSMSKYAPRIVSIKIHPDRIRDVIGPGGKMIRSITETCGVKMEVQDDGTINIAANDETKIEMAKKIIKSLTEEAEVGKIYRGIVKRIVEFGAFVEILPGMEGLLHISQISTERIRRVDDVLKEAEEVMVKVLDVDSRTGKIRLSRTEAMADLANGTATTA